MLRSDVAFSLLLTLVGTGRVARAEEAVVHAEDAGTVPASALAAPSPTAGAVAPAPRNDETVAACVNAAETAQREQSAHRLRSARSLLLACAQTTCPAIVRNDCATWLSEVDRLMPSVVVQARDANGNELLDVRVIVDGELVTSHLDGLAVDVDPGRQLFRFEAAGTLPLEQQILIREGEKGRSLVVSLAPAPPLPPPPREPARRAPPLTHVFGGLAIAGTAGLTYFGLRGRADAANLWDDCGKTKSCSRSEVAPVRRELAAADVSLGVGLLSLGAAIFFYLRDQPSRSHQGVKPDLLLAPGAARFGVQAAF
ncbi:MAG: hypothetical protein JW751_27050 [Polyangiaceae bacterium]|nr:hypothetical protein [Polyangiaceae bacterium]